MDAAWMLHGCAAHVRSASIGTQQGRADSPENLTRNPARKGTRAGCCSCYVAAVLLFLGAIKTEPGSHQDMIAIMVSAKDARRRSSLRSLCPSSQSPSSLSIISAVSVRSTFAHAPSGWQGSARLGASLEAAAAAGWGAEGRCGVAGQARGAQG